MKQHYQHLLKEALKFVKELEAGVLKQSKRNQEKNNKDLSKVTIPDNFKSTTTYQVNNTLLKVAFKSAI